jgi:hypothetical protein
MIWKKTDFSVSSTANCGSTVLLAGRVKKTLVIMEEDEPAISAAAEAPAAAAAVERRWRRQRSIFKEGFAS